MPPTSWRGRGRWGNAGLLALLGVFLGPQATEAASLRSSGRATQEKSKVDILAAASSMVSPGQYGEIGNGEIVNLGHNQHISGLRIHHPKVRGGRGRCHRGLRGPTGN